MQLIASARRRLLLVVLVAGVVPLLAASKSGDEHPARIEKKNNRLRNSKTNNLQEIEKQHENLLLSPVIHTARELLSDVLNTTDTISALTQSPLKILSSVVVAVTSLSGLTVSSCTEDTVHVSGWRSMHLHPGKIFIYTGGGDNSSLCEDCSPLFRRVVAIKERKGLFSRVLRTELVGLSDIIAMTDDAKVNPSSSFAIEHMFDCFHSGGEKRSMLDLRGYDVNLPPYPQVCNDQSRDWYTVDNGKCTYANCCLGTGASDSPECFFCKDTCYNGCGVDALNFDGNFFGKFSFARPCCNHDHCFESIYDLSRCHHEFYVQMLEECPTNRLLFHVRAECKVLAHLFFGLVSIGGRAIWPDTQGKQRDYESTFCTKSC
jgi:hypothetical protein